MYIYIYIYLFIYTSLKQYVSNQLQQKLYKRQL